MKLSVAPISGRYDPTRIREFYREVVASPDIDRAYIGELFCAKRLIPVNAFDEAVEVLQSAGKQAVFSTLALPTGEVDYEAAAPYVERVRAVEINNLGFIPWLEENFPDRDMLAGPLCSLYNRDDIEIVRDLGCSGVSLRIDLMPETILDLCANGALPAEVFLHGRPPLAHSWRCYAARFAGRSAGVCGRVCEQQDGLVFYNLEGEDAFVVDGPAVLPGQVVSTLEQARDYAEANAAFGRLWLEPGSVTPVASVYATLLSGDTTIHEAREALASLESGPIRFGPIARRRLP